MPHAPEKNDQDNPFEVPPVKCGAGHQQKDRCQDEAPAETVEQGAIAVGTDHSREVMPHGPESSDKKIDVLGTPARLRQREYRQDQQRRTNIKHQVTPAIQDPKIRTRPRGRDCRNGLWPRKSGNVLHVEERANYSLEALKINADAPSASWRCAQTWLALR